MISFFYKLGYTFTMYNKKVVVVGGSGGIGAAVALKLADFGGSLTVHGGHDSLKFDELISKLQMKTQQKVQKLVQCIDAENLNFIADIMNSFLYFETKTADILCVCLGPFLQKPLHEMNANEWDKIIRLNCTLPGILLSAVLPEMVRKKWGRIVLFGGTGTDQIKGFRTNAAYAGAKTAVCSIVKSVALEYSSFGITCNAILPGQVDTEYLKKEQRAEYVRKLPSGKLINAEDVAETVMFLINHEEISGALIRQDCGWMPK